MDQKNLKKLGVNLRQLRREKGLTQEKLAEIAQIHPVYVSYIEKGHRNASITKIIRVALALECSAKELFQGIF